MERFIRESPGAEIAAELTGSDSIRLYHDHVLVKEPGTKQRTPWHQDQPYYNVDGVQNASMWFPVDPVDRSATLEFIAGTHRGPWYMPRTFLDDQAKWFPDGSLAELPDFAADPDRWRVLGWALEPGDAVFFNMLTVHGSGGVSGPNRRRVLSVRFLGDDMVHAPRRWTTSPPFDGLDAELADGVPMDHPLFPLLWSRHAGRARVMTVADDPVDRPSGAPRGGRRRAGRRHRQRDDPGAHRRPDRHDAPGQRCRARRRRRSGSACASP